ncbi:MAG: hypothetical protein KAI43_02010 [Candidatus Aureabacteria bacterium]|nr:hypothetical protein [Candidatus Auribacterota bacterium]
MKRIIFILILSFVFLHFYEGTLFAENENKIIAYYFLTASRCKSCHKIEQYTEQALKEYFSEELESGKLILKVVNVDKKENSHFNKDYQLYTKAVVLSLIKNEKEKKYKNLNKVWEYLGSQQKFSDYIRQETQAFLDELTKEN